MAGGVFGSDSADVAVRNVFPKRILFLALPFYSHFAAGFLASVIHCSLAHGTRRHNIYAPDS